MEDEKSWLRQQLQMADLGCNCCTPQDERIANAEAVARAFAERAVAHALYNSDLESHGSWAAKHYPNGVGDAATLLADDIRMAIAEADRE